MVGEIPSQVHYGDGEPARMLAKVAGIDGGWRGGEVCLFSEIDDENEFNAPLSAVKW